jgi:hypothetical protein
MRIVKNIFFIGLILFFSACQKEVQDVDSLQFISQGPETEAFNISGTLTETVGTKSMVSTFTAHLTGQEEVPPVETNATGQAIFRLSRDGQSLHYRLIVANIENVTMAHIHLAPAGQNGPVVLWLYPSGPPPQLIPGVTNGVLSTGVVTSANLVGQLAGASLADLVDLIVAGNAYVNVHTSQFPAGEVRGQIK